MTPHRCWRVLMRTASSISGRPITTTAVWAAPSRSTGRLSQRGEYRRCFRRGQSGHGYPRSSAGDRDLAGGLRRLPRALHLAQLHRPSRFPKTRANVWMRATDGSSGRGAPERGSMQSSTSLPRKGLLPNARSNPSSISCTPAKVNTNRSTPPGCSRRPVGRLNLRHESSTSCG